MTTDRGAVAYRVALELQSLHSGYKGAVEMTDPEIAQLAYAATEEVSGLAYLPIDVARLADSLTS